MVCVAADVVPDGGALVLGDDLEVGEDVLDRPVGPLGSLQRFVRVVDVRLVVLVVVDAHRLLVDVRLERAVVVRQRRDLEGHRSAPFVGWSRFRRFDWSFQTDVRARPARPEAGTASGAAVPVWRGYAPEPWPRLPSG